MRRDLRAYAEGLQDLLRGRDTIRSEAAAIGLAETLSLVSAYVKAQAKK